MVCIKHFVVLPLIPSILCVFFFVVSNHILESVHLFLTPCLIQEFPAGHQTLWPLKGVPSQLDLPHTVYDFWFLIQSKESILYLIYHVVLSTTGSYIFLEIFLLDILNPPLPSLPHRITDIWVIY
jgi:hypothetical protein